MPDTVDLMQKVYDLFAGTYAKARLGSGVSCIRGNGHSAIGRNVQAQ